MTPKREVSARPYMKVQNKGKLTPEEGNAEHNSASPSNTIHCATAAIMTPKSVVGPPPYAKGVPNVAP
jgi:hypothetical protein